MDTIPSEMLRGHVDTIILLSLLDCDKHTNQIKEEIEGRVEGQFELKQGTFYSCLQRIVGQGYVTEYRSSSADGKRRKYYQLTEKGKTYIEDNKDKWLFSRSLIDTLIQVPQDETPIDSIANYQPKTCEIPVIKQEQTVNTETQVAATKTINEQEIEKKIEVIDKLGSKIEQLELQLEKFASNASNLNVNNSQYKNEQNTFINPVSESSTKSNESNKTDEEILEHSDREIDIEEYLRMTEIEKNTAKNLANTSTPPTLSETEKSQKTLDNSEIFKDNYVQHNNSAVEGDNQTEAITQTDEIDNSIDEQSNIRYVEPPKVEPQIQSQPVDSQPVFNYPQQTSFVSQNQYQQPIQQSFYTASPQQQKPQVNDALENVDSARDYKSILEKLFPEVNSKEEQDEEDYFATVVNDSHYEQPIEKKEPIVEQAKQPEEQEESISDDMEPDNSDEILYKHKFKPSKIKKQMKRSQIIEELPSLTTQKKDTRGYDFSDIYSLADKEGFKVRTSSTSVSKESNGKILVNKLVASSSITFFLLLSIEIFVLAYTTRTVAELPIIAYVIFGGVVALFPLLCCIAFFIDPRKKIESIMSFKSVIEFSFVIMLNLILIILVYAFLMNIDFTNVRSLTLYIFYPILFVLNLPIYFFIKYLKLDNIRYFS